MNDALETYKDEVDGGLRASLTWDRDLVFTATTPRGYDLEFDANNEWGCMPLEAMVMSLAGCMAVDVVSILRKMRCPPETFGMEIEARRRPTPPQRITRVRMVLSLTGDVPRDKVDRAVALSDEKYCSVRHSLAGDIEFETEIRLG